MALVCIFVWPVQSSHRLQGINIDNPSPQKVKEKKNFKFDFFLDVEKKICLKRNKETYFFALAGMGFTNINSKLDVVLVDSFASGSFPSHHYKGTFLHFSPRLSLGYQYGKIKASLDGYIIEDPLLANLTSLWLGVSISYEIKHKSKKK